MLIVENQASPLDDSFIKPTPSSRISSRSVLEPKTGSPTSACSRSLSLSRRILKSERASRLLRRRTSCDWPKLLRMNLAPSWIPLPCSRSKPSVSTSTSEKPVSWGLPDSLLPRRYKRQSLNILGCIHRYIRIKKASKAERRNICPHVAFFAGKSAPGYYIVCFTPQQFDPLLMLLNCYSTQRPRP